MKLSAIIAQLEKRKARLWDVEVTEISKTENHFDECYVCKMDNKDEYTLEFGSLPF